jgi:anti-sigma factor RsiW
MNDAPQTAEEFKADDGNEDLLVAYLDGELDSQQTVEVERQLAANPQLRRRLHELQMTWDVLDCLPQTITADQFTKSTIEMVAAEATRDLRRQVQSRSMTWLKRGGLAAVALVAAWGGFQTVRQYQTAEMRELARDLRVIENLDIYRSVRDLEFLKRLEKAGLFVNDEGDHE